MRDLGPAVGPFAERGCGDQRAPLRLEPPAPVGRFQVADICDRRCANIGWRRKAPAHHGEFALAIGREPDDGRHRVGIDGRQGREVAREITCDPE